MIYRLRKEIVVKKNVYRNKKFVHLFSLFFLILLLGCINYTFFQTPDVSPPMKFNGGGGWVTSLITVKDSLGYYKVDLDSLESSTTMNLTLFTRFGIMNNFDIGIRWIPPIDGMLDIKYQIMESPVMLSPALGIGGTWAGWGMSGGFDTTYTCTSLVERYDLSGRLMMGCRLGAITLFIDPQVMRSKYHTFDKTYVYYNHELVREEINREARNTLYQYGIGVGVAFWRLIGEANYVFSREFNAFQFGIGMRSDR